MSWKTRVARWLSAQAMTTVWPRVKAAAQAAWATFRRPPEPGA